VTGVLFYFAFLLTLICSYFSGFPPLVLFRNLVIAPITEELCFRGYMLPILYSSLCRGLSYSPGFIAFVCPIFFGFAHFHHLNELIRNRTPLKIALLIALTQFVYTTIFGVIAAFFLIRTGNICSSILSHAICNVVGLPDVSFRHQPRTLHSSSASFLYPYRRALLLLHAAGLVLFFLFLPITTRELYNSSFYNVNKRAV